MRKILIYNIAAIVLFVAGLLLVLHNVGITGAFLGAAGSFSPLGFVGIIFILASIILFASAHSGLERITSNIKNHPCIQRLAEDATKNQIIQREIDHLSNELIKGNLEAGLGKSGHIGGTDVFYLRGRNGGRLYYHKIENGYEIVGKSAKGRNQDKVMDAIREYYSN